HLCYLLGYNPMPSKNTQTYSVRLSDDLAKRIDAAAALKGITRNACIAAMCEYALARSRKEAQPRAVEVQSAQPKSESRQQRDEREMRELRERLEKGRRDNAALGFA